MMLCAALVGLAGCGADAGSGTSGTTDRVGGGTGEGGPAVPWTDEMQAVADGNNGFACDLYAKLRDGKGNLFLSPYSIHTALAMTATGTKGSTRDQMVKVLHLPADGDKALAAGDLGRFYTAGGKPYELAVANALWGQKGLGWRDDFLKLQKDRFGAGFNEADFVGNPDGERQTINRWVETQTRDKIKDLLKAGDITALTRMVLANAIYFKGKWAEEFKKEATRDGAFRLADGGKVDVPLMRREGQYRYAELDGFQVLEMPYRGGDLSMVIVLPKEPTGLPAVEAQLTADALADWLKKAAATQVEVFLPRFRMEYRFEPAGQLVALGMADAFDAGKADFTGMTAEKMYISKVIHKAFVDVNEEGTEAAAATAVVSRAPSPVPPRPKLFRADRPFLFLIRDARHGTVLFMGRVANPKG
jgi:serpin B